LKEYFCKFPENASNNFKLTYFNILFDINKLKVELEVLYSDVRYQNLLHIHDIIKMIEQDALKDIIPEVYKIFILISTIPWLNMIQLVFQMKEVSLASKKLKHIHDIIFHNFV